MRQIQMNEEIGKQIEELIQEKYYPDGTRPYVTGPGPYDIETSDKVIEVKSCQIITKDKKIKEVQKFRTGRFGIVLSSHEKLKNTANQNNKTPEYAFVLYTQNSRISIIDVVFLTWERVACLLSSARRYRRKKDNVLIANIRHTVIFGQRRLKSE